jgi:hypothetical protein
MFEPLVYKKEQPARDTGQRGRCFWSGCIAPVCSVWSVAFFPGTAHRVVAGWERFVERVTTVFFQYALNFPAHLVPLFVGQVHELLGVDPSHHMYIRRRFDAWVDQKIDGSVVRPFEAPPPLKCCLYGLANGLHLRHFVCSKACHIDNRHGALPLCYYRTTHGFW